MLAASKCVARNRVHISEKRRSGHVTSGGWERTIAGTFAYQRSVAFANRWGVDSVSGSVSSDVGERETSAYQRNVAVGSALVISGGARTGNLALDHSLP